ncbi:MAG: hypothetical protein K6U11_08370 [bacterium]|nr:hypothetical protein [bacterium]
MRNDAVLVRKRVIGLVNAVLFAILVIVFGHLRVISGPAQATAAEDIQQSIWTRTNQRGFEKISESGFGSRHNSYAWSMAWFKGKLYVGTNRDMLCYLALVFGTDYPPEIPDVDCTNPDYRAEIWAFDPQTSSWERVYQSPEISPGVARDQGYRGMIVAIEPDGTEALYIGGYLSKELLANYPARLLRTTDGRNFKEVKSRVPQVLGNIDTFGLRSFAQYKGKLYMTANMNPPERPRLMEIDLATLRDEGDHIRADITQVNPPQVQPFEVEVFNGYLYTGTVDPENGFSVLKTDATTKDENGYYNFIPVVTHGAWRLDRFGKAAYNLNEYVISMCTFKNRLYIGTGCGLGGFDFVTKVGPAPAEIIRINPDDTWQLVCGRSRRTPDGLKAPISRLPAGMGNPFSGYIWRMAVHRDWLYVATMDSSIALRNPDIMDLLNRGNSDISTLLDLVKSRGGVALGDNAGPNLSGLVGEKVTDLISGFDLWKTRNGVQWYPVTMNGFGDKFNIGARTMVSTPVGLFVGTANPYYGAQVWLGDDRFPFARNLQAEPDGQAIKLRWTAPAGSIASHIYRKQLLGMDIGLLKDEEAGPLGFEEIAVTREQYYLDPNVEMGTTYIYQVRAETESGELSSRSNLALCRMPGEGLKIFAQNPRPERQPGQWTQVITLINQTGLTQSSPLYYILEGLSEGTSLLNQSGTAENGSPYLMISPGQEGILPREKIRLQLRFSTSSRSRSKSAINYTPFVLTDPLEP